MDTLPLRQDLSNSHIIQEENISTLGQVELGTYQGTHTSKRTMNIKAEINSKLYFNSHLLSLAYANQSSRIYSTDIILLFFYVVQQLSFIF